MYPESLRLAQKLLAAVRRTSNTQDIQQFLDENVGVKVQGMPAKPLKTLKRRSRGHAWHKAGVASQKARKDSRKKPAEKRVRAKKDEKQQRVSETETKHAYRQLKANGWAWKPKVCYSCGGLVQMQTWRSCRHRGRGRLFVKCLECLAWFDVLVWSSLFVVRMPLQCVWKARVTLMQHV